MIAQTVIAPIGSPPPSTRLANDETLFEVVDGVRTEIPAMGFKAATLAGLLSHWLWRFVLEHDLGIVTVEGLFQLSETLSRRPDLAVVARTRLPADFDTQADPAGFVGAPNLAVEIVSPTNTAQEIEQKVFEYFSAGVETVWVVFPSSQRVHVYSSPTRADILWPGQTLAGTGVLAGFRLSLDELFGTWFKPIGQEKQ